MIYIIPEIGVMIQNEVRKKKKTCFNDHFERCTFLEYKMWSLKSLAMLKCDCRNSLHAVQYK